MFLSVSKAGVVHIIHSLSVVQGDAYNEAPALWGIRGDVSTNKLPHIVVFSTMDFAYNDSFCG